MGGGGVFVFLGDAIWNWFDRITHAWLGRMGEFSFWACSYLIGCDLADRNSKHFSFWL